jgi:hypothetical protein
MERNCSMVINFSDVLWARDAGFSLAVIRAALKDVADGWSNFPDACVYNDLLASIKN